MITDIPTEEELRSAAIELLVMVWKTAISSLHKVESARDVGLDDDETRSELGAACLPSLRHAAAWIHQAQELGLKARIAGVSPYLLLAGDPRSWPRPGQGGEVLFADFRTIHASDLIRVHDTVCASGLPADFVRRFEVGRRDRNRIVHLGGGGIAADALAIIREVLRTAEDLFLGRRWASDLMEAAFVSDDAILNVDNVEWALLADFALVSEHLQPSELRRHFGYDPRRRSYVCLKCSAEEMDHEDSSTFAQLELPSSDQLFCPVCTEMRTVLREKCDAPGCRSDVLFADSYKVGTCLVCLNAHSRFEEARRVWRLAPVIMPPEGPDLAIFRRLALASTVCV